MSKKHFGFEVPQITNLELIELLKPVLLQFSHYNVSEPYIKGMFVCFRTDKFCSSFHLALFSLIMHHHLLWIVNPHVFSESSVVVYIFQEPLT
jgi:hypothetical protein